MADLSDLIRQIAFYKAGGLPQGTRDIDKIDQIFQTLGQTGNNLSNFAKQALDRKREELAIQQQQPIGTTLGLPTAQQQALAEAKAKQDFLNKIKGVQDYLNTVPAEAQSNLTPEELQAHTGEGIPQYIPTENKRAQFEQKFGFPSEALDLPSSVAEKLIELKNKRDLLTSKQSNEIYANPITGARYGSLAEVPQNELSQVYKVSSETGFKTQAAKELQNTPQNVVTEEEAKNLGKVSKGTRIIEKSVMSPYADVRATSAILQDLPSRQSPTKVAGAASQVHLAVKQGIALIAEPGSPQQIALASSDLARAIQRSAPQLETLHGASFANNIITQISLLSQKLTANPNGADAPKVRKQIYDILNDLEESSKPFIERSLQETESFWKDRLPSNWEEIKRKELGEGIQKKEFKENVYPSISNPKIRSSNLDNYLNSDSISGQVKTKIRMLRAKGISDNVILNSDELRNLQP